MRALDERAPRQRAEVTLARLLALQGGARAITKRRVA